MKSAIEIANSARLLPITEVAAAAGILPEELVPFGFDRGKVKLSILDRLASRPDGKLVTFLQGLQPKLNAYMQDHLVAMPGIEDRCEGSVLYGLRRVDATDLGAKRRRERDYLYSHGMSEA